MANEFHAIEEGVASYYSAKVREHGDSPRGADWKDEASQRLRFDVLRGCLRSRSGFSLLDVGCGTAAFRDYLVEQGCTEFRYHGLDLSEDMIAAARTRLAGEEGVLLTVGNLEAIEARYDYVVSSGILNVKQGTDEEWRRYVLAAIDRQFELADVTAAFNAMTSFVDFEAEHLCYSDPGAILAHCKGLSRFVTLHHDYPLYEFTVFVHRESPWPRS